MFMRLMSVKSVDWLFLKLQPMKLQHLLCSLSAQYQVMMREKGRVVETVGTLG